MGYSCTSYSRVNGHETRVIMLGHKFSLHPCLQLEYLCAKCTCVVSQFYGWPIHVLFGSWYLLKEQSWAPEKLSPALIGLIFNLNPASFQEPSTKKHLIVLQRLFPKDIRLQANNPRTVLGEFETHSKTLSYTSYSYFKEKCCISFCCLKNYADYKNLRDKLCW